MNYRLACVLTMSLALSACSGGETPPESAQPKAPPPEAATAEPEVVVDDAFLDHMHAHAEMLDEINYALADDDLMASVTPAYWLSRHDAVKGIPDAWKPYVIEMRKAAADVESAENLEAARAAADRVAAQCSACHVAAGVMPE